MIKFSATLSVKFWFVYVFYPTKLAPDLENSRAIIGGYERIGVCLKLLIVKCNYENFFASFRESKALYLNVFLAEKFANFSQ